MKSFKVTSIREVYVEATDEDSAIEQAIISGELDMADDSITAKIDE